MCWKPRVKEQTAVTEDILPPYSASARGSFPTVARQNVTNPCPVRVFSLDTSCQWAS